MLELYSYERNLESELNYYIDSDWLNSWLLFMRNPENVKEPGPITNEYLRENLDIAVERDDYYVITDKLWKMYKAIYGGGPTIPVTDKEKEDPKLKKLKKNSSKTIDLYHEHKIQNIPSIKKLTDGISGFQNDFLFCYLNACLQMLLSVFPLRDFLINKIYEKCSKIQRQTKGIALSSALTQIFQNVWLPPTSKGSTKTKNLQFLLKSTFSPFNENDCHQALLFILSSLQEQLTPKVRNRMPTHGKNVEEVWKNYRTKNPSVIDELFAGLLRSTVTCLGCKHDSVTYDPFYDILLPIKGLKGDITLCLDRFLQKELLDKKSYGCQNCGKFNKAAKKLDLVKLPPYLIFVLKRFSGQGAKIKTKISFPLKLQLSKQKEDKISIE